MKIHPAKPYLIIFWVCLGALFSACANVPQGTLEQDAAPLSPASDRIHVADVVPKYEALSAQGNPVSYVVMGRKYYTLRTRDGYDEQGLASWYGTKFHGRHTSNGEVYNMYAMTAAHKTLPLPAYVHVTNLDNGKEIIVRVNDRGPFHEGRIIDLSYAAASRLDMMHSGTARVRVRSIAPPNTNVQAATSFFVQVGAYSQKDNAQRMVSRLHNERLASNIHVGNLKNANKKVYRVRLGPYETLLELDEITHRLKSLGLAPTVFSF